MLSLEILAILLLTLINGALSMSEMALVSSRKSRLEQMARHSRGAKLALGLLNDPGKFLSAIQIGITLAGIVAGAYSGATIGHRLGVWLDTIEFVSPHGYTAGVGITVIVITYISLIAGELLPKRIALAMPERIAAAAAVSMRALTFLTAPAVWFLHVSTVAALRLFRINDSRDASVTEEEIKSLIAEGTDAGVFIPQEREMITGVLRLADRPVRAIMTPRPKITWIDENADRNAIAQSIETSRFSKILVCDGSIDRPIGVVHTKQLLPYAMKREDIPLRKLASQLLVVPDNIPVLSLLTRFQQERIHVALIVNEYGGTDGIVTLTDVIESIVGDLPESTEDAPGIVQRSDGSWLVDGMLLTDNIADVTGVQFDGKVSTIAGFVLNRLKTIPVAGASFVHGNARFEIMDMDGNRIDKILVELLRPGNPE